MFTISYGKQYIAPEYYFVVAFLFFLFRLSLNSARNKHLLHAFCNNAYPEAPVEPAESLH